MIHRSLLSFASCFVAICLIGSTQTCEAAIIDSGTFLTIDDAGNPSDGLQYLNMSFSDGQNQANAIANGVAGGFAGTRVATAAEFDDLFAAAGIMYNGARTAANGFAVGVQKSISSGGNYDGGILSSQLGLTFGLNTFIWTDPDGSGVSTTTRDYLRLSLSAATIHQTPTVPANSLYGWLLVNGSASAVPEPSSALLLGFASLLGIATYRRKRKTS